MGQGKLEEVILRGLRADQPLATDVGPGTLYYVTDESVLERVSTASAWQSYSGASGALGINQLTGDVTAGPGVGSQAATIGNDKVTTAKILNSNVTLAKIVNVSAASKLIGRGSAGGAGVQEEITLGTNLSMSGTTLNATDTDTGINQLTGDVTAGPGNGSQAATIGNDKVVTAKILNSNVTLAKIVDVSAASRLIGRGSASGSGVQQEITLGTGLSMSGTTISATGAGSTTLVETVGQLEFSNSGADNALYSKSIAGGLITATGFIQLTFRGDYLNNTGGTRFLTVSIKYGGTTLWSSSTGNIAAGAARRGLWIDVVLGNLGATNSQFGQINFELGDLAAAGSGFGSLNATPLVATRTGYGTSAEDSTGALTFQLLVTQSGTPSASQAFRRQFGCLELFNA